MRSLLVKAKNKRPAALVTFTLNTTRKEEKKKKDDGNRENEKRKKEQRELMVLKIKIKGRQKT